MRSVMDPAAKVASAARFIGQRIARQEDVRFLTGRSTFVDDVSVPGVLHVAFARSNVARGTITSIDVSAAKAMPGVSAVLLASDLNHRVLDHLVDQELTHPSPRPFRLLADGDVRFVGEAIAMVIANSRYCAEDAVELIQVDVEPLDPVVDYERALDTGSPVVHPELGTNLGIQFPPSGNPRIKELLDSAAVVLTETFKQHRYACVPMETRGTVASWDPRREEFTIWSSTQGPAGVRSWMARLLRMDESRIRVIMPDVGGAFGLKMFPSPEEIATVLAAKQLGQPVKWIEDRREHLMAGWQSREEQGTMTLALDDEGRFLAGTCEFLENSGAYPAALASSMVLAKMVMTGPYKFSAFDVHGRCVYTNAAGRCGYRGPWMIESVVREQMVDEAARRLGIDPLEIRRRNIVHDDELPYTMPSGFPLDNVTIAATLEQAAEIIGYEQLRKQQKDWREEGRLIGIGIGLIVEPTSMGFGPMSSEATTIRIGVNGGADVVMSSISTGQGLATTVAQVVADELGIDVDLVKVSQGDTLFAPLGGGSGGSRAAVFASGSARAAARDLRDRIVAIAAHNLEAAPEDIEIVDSRVRVVGTPTRGMTITEVARKAYYEPMTLPQGLQMGLEASSRYAPEGMCTWSNGCHMCLVEVDRVTGAVKILRYVVSEDCGVMINPNIVEGQIAGGVVQGIGGVLYEHLAQDEHGNPLATTFADYLLPTTTEVPIIEYGHIETPSPTNPGGHKGLGEGGAIASPAAVCNAVADALAPLGAKVRSQPLSPAHIVEMIEAAAASRAEVQNGA